MIYEGRVLDLQNVEDRRIYNRLYMREYLKNNKEKMRAYSLQYYQDHKASMKGYMQKYNANITQKQLENKRETNRTRAYIRYNFDDEFREKKKQENKERYKNRPETKKQILEYYKDKYKNNTDGFRDKATAYSKAYNNDPITVFFGVGTIVQTDKKITLSLI
jgi:hypothetical protein